MKTDIPKLPDYSQIQEHLDIERKTILKVNDFSDDETEYVRDVEDAEIILEFVEEIQSSFRELFVKIPSLVSLFKDEFLSFHEFVQRSFVLDLIFLDDCLIPEKEMFLFGQDGAISENVLKLHKRVLKDWVTDKEKDHTETQKNIKDEFNSEKKFKELSCRCTQCAADYKTRLRDYYLKESFLIIEEGKSNIEKNINENIGLSSQSFTDMKKEIDRSFYKIRYRLKRSSLNRLETQVKNKIKEVFTYPSELALKREQALKPFFHECLKEEGLNEDLIGEKEYKRFFGQLEASIWRKDGYLRREFHKLAKSVMILKRKDISGTILQEYLGEFWIHSQARTINRKIIYHMGPTNSGKTYHSIEALCKAEKGCYLAPLRLLAGELYDTMNSKGVLTSLLTGEEVVDVEGATHYSSTIEMAKLTEHFDCCVIDEIQMITDSQRGWAWTRALVNVFATEVHICGDPSALSLIQTIVDLCGDELEIKEYTRMTELNVEASPVVLGDLKKNDALIVFSRRAALRYKMDLERIGFKVSIVYGRLSPEVRREQARKFDQGETDIIVSTDAIAMGMNLPIKRVIFSTLTKFFNSQEHPISESEIKQIAGRAGRYKRFPTGYVSCLTKVDQGLEKVNDALKMTLDQQKKCMVGPDLDIFSQVNNALVENSLPTLKLSEFLRLFNTMIFKKPFYCVDLKEMIGVAEMVEEADGESILTQAEIFGFACAPINLGLLEHVQYFVWILNNYVASTEMSNEPIDFGSRNIDYLETSIKCVELYQWLSRHFNNKNFNYDLNELLHNKSKAVEQLNTLLSDKIVRMCSSCGVKLPDENKFAICENCFKKRRFTPKRGGGGFKKKAGSSSRGGPRRKKSIKRKSGGRSSAKNSAKNSGKRRK